MKANSTLKLLLIVLLLFLASGLSISAVYASQSPENQTDTKATVDVIVTFSQQATVPDAIPLVQVHHRYQIINGIAATIPESYLGILESLPFVESVEEDFEVSLLEDTLDWGVDKIDAEVVWGGSENAVDVIPDSFAGQGAKVAILDTGIQYTHPDLNDNYYGGYDYVNNDNDPMDDHGHGTHCAGIVAAEDNEQGVIGVAPYAQLYGVKVLNAQGSGSYSDIIAGIDWAAANGMDVISMSLGGSSGTSALEQALQNAYNSGVVIVAASGNDYAGSISYPARYATCIAVGATDSSDTRASFSNYGPQLEVTAPGVSIYSTITGSSYATMSGTSMATPMVSGTVALMLSKNPTMSPDQVRQILHDSALDLGSAGWDQYYGYGRVQADEAVTLVPSDGDTTPPQKVTGLAVTTVSSSQLALTWNPVADADLSYYRIYRDGAAIGTSTTTSYSDTGLMPSTTYTYEVSAVDTSANEGLKSDPVSGTTAPPGAEDTIHVYSIDMWYVTYAWWFFYWHDVYIKVTVHDNTGAPEAGVTVYLDLTLPGGGVASGSGVTGTDGSVTFVYESGLWESGWYTATVTDLIKTGFTYAPGDNLETSESLYVS